MIADTSAVQEQYESFPFPPLAIGSLKHVKPVPADAQFAFQYVYGRSAPGKLRILDAGCGTGFSTLKLAQANPQAEIIAIDFSRTSLNIAQQRLTAAKLQDQIQFIQSDLQDLPDLGLFDYIHCSGVLHHLPDPVSGLKHLRRSLNPDGIAYLMVYSARARQDIQMIQTILYSLWRDHSNWQEGLMLCRMFFKGLAREHPLRRHYENAIQVATELLGREAAQSDAFVVDTWLQRCEHLWTANQWLDLLRSHEWFPARWLDEQAWDLRPYLPALPDYVAHLDEFTKMEILDQLRPAQNFAKYLTPQAVSIADPVLNTKNVPHTFAFVTLHQGTESLLDNGRGVQIRLSQQDLQQWKSIDGQTTWHDIWLKMLQLNEAFSVEVSQAFARQLLDYHCVWQKNPGAI